MAGDVTVRALRTLDEIAPLERLQTDIWGYGAASTPVYPARGLLAFVESGGLVGGACDAQDTLLGFSAAWIGREHDRARLYLHSQIVGVLEPYRDRGVGRLLKLQQRDFAIAHGLALVKWTFDPLRPRNAYVNLHTLGAVARHAARSARVAGAGAPSPRASAARSRSRSAAVSTSNQTGSRTTRSPAARARRSVSASTSGVLQGIAAKSAPWTRGMPIR